MCSASAREQIKFKTMARGREIKTQIGRISREQLAKRKMMNAAANK
jgi:hypothetical protein